MQRPSERAAHARHRRAKSCERLGLKAMLDGTHRGAGHELRADAQRDRLPERRDRRPASRREATSKEDVLKVLGPMASAMRTRLGESLPSIKQFDVPIEQATTPSLPALKAYALGVAERRKRARARVDRASSTSAIELDPEFAAAYTTLSTVYGSIGEWRRSEEYAQLAYARSEARQRAGAAVHHVPVPRPRHRQSGRGGTDAGAVEERLPARSPAAERARADLQPVRTLTTRPSRKRPKRSGGARATRSRCRTSPSRIAGSAATRTRRKSATKRSRSGWRRRRHGGCSTSSGC